MLVEKSAGPKTCLTTRKANRHDPELVGLGEELWLHHGSGRHVENGTPGRAVFYRGARAVNEAGGERLSDAVREDWWWGRNTGSETKRRGERVEGNVTSRK